MITTKLSIARIKVDQNPRASRVVNVAEALVDALIKEGVDTTFGLVGGGIEEIVGRIVSSDIRYVQSRHEQGAVGMADGYSRATGKIGVALVSHGAGLSNAGTQMIVSRKARSRVLVIASDTGDEELFVPHNFDQEPFLSATIGSYITIRNPSVAERDLARAFRSLRAGSGPIALNLPSPIASSNVPEPWMYAPTTATLTSPPAAPDAQTLADLATRLASAHRPVLLAGAGAVSSGAGPAIAALAERFGAALAETLLAKGLFAAHPRALGVSGGFGRPDAQLILAQADLVIAFGATISRYTSSWGSKYANAYVVRIDSEPNPDVQLTPHHQLVVADARVTAEALLSAVGERPDTAPWHTNDDDLGSASPAPSASPEYLGTGVDLRWAILELDRALPRSRALLADGGDAIAIPASSFGVDHPRDQMLPWEFWSIGVGVSIAIGASIGRPDRLTVAFIGDGALMLALADLDTAAREQARILFVIPDNGGFGAERPAFDKLGFGMSANEFANPDIAEVAHSLGFDAYSAHDNTEFRTRLDELLATGLAGPKPYLLCLHTDKAVATPEIERAYQMYRPT